MKRNYTDRKLFMHHEQPPWSQAFDIVAPTIRNKFKINQFLFLKEI